MHLRTGMESVTKDAEIMIVLHRLGLEAPVERVGGLDADKDWDDVFSIGEQHLLSIARIFLAHPAFVFLVRPGSSLPRAQIAIILDMLTDQGIGVVVLAKDVEANLRYDSILEIKPDGKWVVHTKYWPKPGTLVFSRDQAGRQLDEHPESAADTPGDRAD